MGTLKRKNADGNWEYIQVSGLDVAQLQESVDSFGPQLNQKLTYKKTINDVINASDLIVNDVIKVNGYYSVNDGGGHYRIISATNNGSGVLLTNGLYANIFHDDYVSVKWFGAISSSSTDYRDTEFQKFLDYIKTGLAKYFDLGDKIIYLQLPHSLTFSSSYSGFTLDHSKGGQLYFTINTPDPCLQIGIDSSVYTSLSNVSIPFLNINAVGQQTHGLKLYTKGRNDHAFWNSRFGKLKIAVDRGKGIGIYNGVFECQFDVIRVDNRRKYLETQADPITSNDIPLYLCNENGENIISSLVFNFINVWGGWQGVKTEGTGGKFAPDFSVNEIHVFDSKREGIYLNNQTGANFINKLHLEFQGEASNPVYGCFWNGYGVIKNIEGGSDYMLGFVKTYNQNAKPLIIENIIDPYNMPLKVGLVYVYMASNGVIRVDREYTDLTFDQYCVGTLYCNINKQRAQIKFNNKDIANITKNLDKDMLFTHNQGVSNRASHVQVGFSGINGGQTDLATLDFTQQSNIMKWDNGGGNQANVKLGFYGATAVVKPTITGSRGGNAALASLLTQLATLGLIVDNTTV